MKDASTLTTKVEQSHILPPRERDSPPVSRVTANMNGFRGVQAIFEVRGCLLLRPKGNLAANGWEMPRQCTCGGQNTAVAYGTSSRLPDHSRDRYGETSDGAGWGMGRMSSLLALTTATASQEHCLHGWILPTALASARYALLKPLGTKDYKSGGSAVSQGKRATHALRHCNVGLMVACEGGSATIARRSLQWPLGTILSCLRMAREGSEFSRLPPVPDLKR